MIALLFSQPWVFIAWFAAFLLSLSVHEAAHAAMGNWLGDPTAKRMGRLTLNPAAHIDLTGLFFMMFAGFGWGKPVPFNPYHLKWPTWGPVFVAFAGPGSNLILALIGLGILAPIAVPLGMHHPITMFLLIFIQLNLALLAFNLIPLPPLDGSKLLLTALSHPRHAELRNWIEMRGPFLLLGLVLIDSIFHIGIFSWVISAVSSAVLGVAQLLGIVLR